MYWIRNVWLLHLIACAWLPASVEPQRAVGPYQQILQDAVRPYQQLLQNAVEVRFIRT